MHNTTVHLPLEVTHPTAQPPPPSPDPDAVRGRTRGRVGPAGASIRGGSAASSSFQSRLLQSLCFEVMGNGTVCQQHRLISAVLVPII